MEAGELPFNGLRMLQILQSLKTGETMLAEVPAPMVLPGELLIATHASLVSAGTERTLVDFGKSGWLQKARSQPDKVKAVIEKIKVDGLKPTLQAVKSKLDQPLPMGYCNVGSILELGPGVSSAEFSSGDRVVSNGNHAEIVSVAKNLCCKVPPGLSDEEASFTVVGAIGLQGIRLLQPTLGESVVVTGLGLIGLLCVQMLKANGCRVLGIDFDSSKCALAKSYGAEVVDLSKGEDPGRFKSNGLVAWAGCGWGFDHGFNSIQRACSSGRIDVTETRSHCFGRSSRARAFKSRFL